MGKKEKFKRFRETDKKSRENLKRTQNNKDIIQQVIYYYYYYYYFFFYFYFIFYFIFGKDESFIINLLT